MFGAGFFGKSYDGRSYWGGGAAVVVAGAVPTTSERGHHHHHGYHPARDRFPGEKERVPFEPLPERAPQGRRALTDAELDRLAGGPQARIEAAQLEAARRAREAREAIEAREA